ncbi:hypothetical protein AnigIFM50267_010815 [Aspergillus niger]|nr:hypothetical protein AnigIFM50267_010815 [Aspergillus niger]
MERLATMISSTPISRCLQRLTAPQSPSHGIVSTYRNTKMHYAWNADIREIYRFYWDWTLDASTNPLHSPIWSHEFGLGGNGSHPANCVEDGPFAAIKPQYPEPHCLQRKFSDENMYGREYTASIVNAIVTESNSYGEFRERLEAGPHRFIHLAIGGDMPELWSSNGTLRTTSPLLH